MILFPGGISKLEFNNVNNFSSGQTEIPGVMKEGTKVDFKTPTEEDAAGRIGTTGKEVEFAFESKDLTDTPYATLRGYEAASTPIYFKITGLNPAQSLILKQVSVIVELKPSTDKAKTWKRLVRGSGFAATETDLMTLTLA